MKKLTILFTSLFVAVAAHAATYTTNIVDYFTGIGATPGLILTNQGGGGLLINSITLANTGTTNCVFRFVDAPDPGWRLWTNSPGGVTNNIIYSTNVIVVITNYNGVVQTVTNNALVSIATTNAAIAYNRPTLITLSVSNGITYTFVPSSPLVAGRGIALTNVGIGTVTINYSTLP